MNAEKSQASENKTLMLGGALAGVATTAVLADSMSIDKLITDLQSADDAIRGAAWQGAATSGAAAVKPLAGLMAHQDFEIARAAKRALWMIVRYVGRPKAEEEGKAVQVELIFVLHTAPASVRRDVVWMLSEIGDEMAIQPLAALLTEAEVREDARCALERIPSSKAVRALEQALKTGPEEFRPALANSLRVRGRKVAGYPSLKLVPTNQTTVGAK